MIMQLVRESIWVVSWFKPKEFGAEGHDYTMEAEEFGSAREVFAAIRDSNPDHSSMVSVTFDGYNAYARGGVLVPEPYLEGGPPEWMGVPSNVQGEYKEAYDLRKEWS